MDFWKSLNASKHPVSTPTRPAKEEWDAGQKTAQPFSVIGGVSEQIRGSELGKQEKGFEMGGGGRSRERGKTSRKIAKQKRSRKDARRRRKEKG